MSERDSCTYCGADAERGHSCEKSPNVDEALRRINEGSLVYCDLSDPMDYDISLVVAEITALRTRLSSAEAERDRLRETLREGVEEAWCDAVLGIAPHLVENGRAVGFRDHFYGWQKRARALLTPHAETK